MDVNKWSSGYESYSDSDSDSEVVFITQGKGAQRQQLINKRVSELKEPLFPILHTVPSNTVSPSFNASGPHTIGEMTDVTKGSLSKPKTDSSSEKKAKEGEDLHKMGLSLHENDPKKAYECYVESAKRGHPQALYQLGSLWDRGEVPGHPKDMQKAYDFYMQAAEFDDVDALFALGKFWEEGEVPGQAADIEKAFEYYVRAAEVSEYGDSDVCYALSRVIAGVEDLDGNPDKRQMVYEF